MAKRPHVPGHPRLFKLYYATIVIAAAMVLAVLTPHASPAAPVTLGLALLALSLSESSAVALPGGGYASMGGALDLACLIVIGPVYTAWLNVAATFLAQGLVLRKPPIRVVHNMAIFALTAAAAGTSFIAAGGRVGQLEFPRDIGPLLACGAVHFLCNSVLVSTVIGLSTGPSPWRVWRRAFLRGLLYHLSFLAMGSLVALVYLKAGPWALMLFAVPFVLARHSFKLYVEIRTDLKDFVRALSEILEEVDPYTRQHSVRVSRYAVRLARELRCPDREVEDLEYAALVHDLGKIGPQNQHILQKPGTLSHEEQRTLRSHPVAGAGIIGRVRALRRAADVVRYHHERPDGRGYPFGLRTESVPLGARILNVADAFDAMTSDRSYRRALQLDAALRELERGGGTQFDQDVVNALLRLNERGHFEVIPSPSCEELLSLRVRPRQVPA